MSHAPRMACTAPKSPSRRAGGWADETLDKGITIYTEHSLHVWLSRKGYAVLACFGLLGGHRVINRKEGPLFIRRCCCPRLRMYKKSQGGLKATRVSDMFKDLMGNMYKEPL